MRKPGELGEKEKDWIRILSLVISVVSLIFITNKSTLMTRKIFQSFKVHLDPYDYDVHFCVGDTSKSAGYCNKIHNLPTKEILGWAASDLIEVRGLRLLRRGYEPIIWLPRRPQTPIEYGTLSHEIMHVVGDIARHVGLVHCKESEEAFCYLQGILTRKFLEKCK